MPSKRSSTRRSPSRPWKAARSCSESDVALIATQLASALGPRDRVLLEGELGAGKTFFARALLLALGARQPPEGSPSFAIAHEYDAKPGPVAHLDLYRIRSEAELEEAGILHYFWERELLVICEWTSLWLGLWTRLNEPEAGRSTFVVTLKLTEDPALPLRDLEISRSSG